MRYFEKVALRTSVDDVEDQLGFLVPDEYENHVRQKAEEMRANSLALRHPILTGIPTLGLWPAFAKSDSDYRVAKSLLKTYPYMLAKHEAREQAALAHDRELDKIREANEITAAPTRILAASYLAGKAMQDRNSN